MTPRLWSLIATYAHRLAVYASNRAADAALDRALLQWVSRAEREGFQNMSGAARTRPVAQRQAAVGSTRPAHQNTDWSLSDTVAAMVAYGSPVPSAYLRESMRRVDAVVARGMAKNHLRVVR